MDKFTFEESGVNPVNTASDNKDLYFTNVKNNQNEQKNTQNTQKNINREKARKKRDNKSVRNTYIFFIVVIVISMALSVYAILCLNDILAITKDSATVTISLEEPIDNISDAVDLLADNDLIKCKQFCKFFANYRKAEVGPEYEAGVYYLNGKMGLEGMLQTLQGDTSTAETVTLTFPEGYTVPEIVDKLSENEVCDKASLLSVIETVDFSYSLVSDKKSSEEVPYRLEGYLFPDTYDFYIGESASSVVKKFLENGDSKITQKYRNRAKELGYSMDDIIKIASIIQSEAGNEDQMKKISAVIHNRLDDSVNFPMLGVDSTSDYITNKVAPALTSTSSHTSDYYLQYYNTSEGGSVTGLPPSPICNPGEAAIKAALYPSKSNALYFFHDKDGNMYTAKTLSEFKEKVNEYAPYLNY